MREPSQTTARRERDGLADALLAAGPDAPTLCEGWTALDLAAHVVVRERRVDSLPGLRGGRGAGWTDRVRHRATAQGLDRLVAKIRQGPPPWSPFAVPGVDARLNLLEFLVHHEDVRRGGGAGPRPLTDDPHLRERLQEDVWDSLGIAARLLLRVPGGVLLRRTDRPGDVTDLVVGRGEDPVVVSGLPVEVALFVFGRRAAAVVEVSGSSQAQERLAAHGGAS